MSCNYYPIIKGSRPLRFKNVNNRFAPHPYRHHKIVIIVHFGLKANNCYLLLIYHQSNYSIVESTAGLVYRLPHLTLNHRSWYYSSEGVLKQGANHNIAKNANVYCLTLLLI